MEFIYEPEFWVAVSFFIFIGVLVYLGIHKKVVSALDARALRISKELEEARRLREEAEKVLADYRRKLGDVVTEVDNIKKPASETKAASASKRGKTRPGKKSASATAARRAIRKTTKKKPIPKNAPARRKPSTKARRSSSTKSRKGSKSRSR